MTAASMMFKFKNDHSYVEALGTLELAKLAVESLFGPERTNLETCVDLDRERRHVVIDVSERVSRTLALVFSGFARREFAARDLTVEHLLPTREGVREPA